MSQIVEVENLNIEGMIYEIREKQVMLDSDLARLYECKNGTKTINQAVKRHINKFPERYMFQLTKSEYDNLKSQVGTSSLNNYGGVRKMPYVFTEQGVAMLATILKTPVADTVSMRIIDAFVYMKKYLSFEYKNSIILNHENRILKLEESFDKLNEKQKINTIFYEGQIYDAYSLLIDILCTAKKEIIVIDNYAGKELLDILKEININIKIVSSNIDNMLKKKYESQYYNVSFINNNTFNDRFLIIDRKILYNSGSSFKDLGKKYFYIGKIDDEEILNNILIKIGG